MIGRGRRVAIAGVGYYLPERVLSNQELEKTLETTDEWIRTRTGIRERRIAAADQASSDLGLAAAERALADAGVTADRIDLIIVSTSSPDMVFPATACLIQSRLGAVHAGAFDLTAVCSGFAYALAVGSQAVACGQADHVLVVAAEKFSSLLDWQDRSTCVLMGDGAGAVVLTTDAPRGEILTSILGADSRGIEYLWIPGGGSARPASHDTVNQRLHYMKMNGPEIYRFGVNIIGEVVEKALAAAGLKPSDLDLLIPHQANLRIMESAARRFHLSMDKIMVNIDRYSNTSSASVPIALGEAKEQGRLKPGMIVVLAAMGAGLTWGASVVRW